MGAKQPWKVKWTYLGGQIDAGRPACSRARGRTPVTLSISAFFTLGDTLIPAVLRCPRLAGDAQGFTPVLLVWLGSFHPTLNLFPAQCGGLLRFPRGAFSPISDKENPYLLCQVTLMSCSLLSQYCLAARRRNFPEGFVKYALHS